jgi:hypothetical protein
MHGRAPVLVLGCVAGLAAATVASGCATMTRTKSDDQLFVDSNPQGAMVLVDGLPSGTTPQLVPMPRGHAISVVCALPGHRDASAVVRRELAPATAFDSPVLAVIDELTGAAYRLQRRTPVPRVGPDRGAVSAVHDRLTA